MEFAEAIVVDCSAGAAVGINRNLPHPGPRLQHRAFAKRLGPVGDVGGCLGTYRAPEHALAMQVAARAAVVRTRDDSVVRNPPVPPQLVKTLGDDVPQNSNRQWRRWPRRARRVRRVARQSRYAHLAVIHVVVTLEVL